MPPKSDLYFDSMRKKSCLENNEPSFLSLGDKLPSASDWNREHLVAARVIIKDSNKLPQELQNRLKDIRRQGLERNKHASASLFVGDLPQDHRFQGENSLLRADDTPGGLVGHFWSALADLENGLASNMDADDVACSADPDTGRPSRNQQPVSRPGMVSSATTFGSSSPVQPSSQLEPSSDNEAFVDSAIHIKAVAESMTVRLVGSAIRLACFEAGRGLADVVAEYRPTELTLTETMPGAAGQVLTARNDGGIRVRRALARGRGYGNSDGADLVVALLEAKREPLTTLVAGRVAVPDKWLAQMTCEALTACLFAKDHPRRPKSSDYSERPTETLNVYATQWFNLKEKNDRKQFLYHVWAILQEHFHVRSEERREEPYLDTNEDQDSVADNDATEEVHDMDDQDSEDE